MGMGEIGSFGVLRLRLAVRLRALRQAQGQDDGFVGMGRAKARANATADPYGMTKRKDSQRRNTGGSPLRNGTELRGFAALGTRTHQCGEIPGSLRN